MRQTRSDDRACEREREDGNEQSQRALWAARVGAFFTLLFLAFLVVAIVTGDIGE